MTSREDARTRLTRLNDWRWRISVPDDACSTCGILIHFGNAACQVIDMEAVWYCQSCYFNAVKNKQFLDKLDYCEECNGHKVHRRTNQCKPMNPEGNV